MPVENTPATPSPDDFDRQLRDLTSGAAGTARFREPSAAERAKQAAKPSQPQPMSWRKARKAAKLRGPDGPPGRKRPGAGLTGRRADRGRAGRQGGRMPPSTRRQRLRSIARTVAVLIAFVALLFVLHLLGFGPH